MLDNICNCGHAEQKAAILQREIRRFIIQACVAIIKDTFDGPRVEDGKKLGFMRTRLGFVFKAVDWIYKLNGAVVHGVGAAAEDKERLERVVGPLSEGILGAMTAILREESSREETSEGNMKREVKEESMEEVEDTQFGRGAMARTRQRISCLYNDIERRPAYHILGLRLAYDGCPSRSSHDSSAVCACEAAEESRRLYQFASGKASPSEPNIATYTEWI